MKRPIPSFLTALFLLAAVTPAFSETITLVGVDEETNDAWRTSGVAKPLDGDGDNIYGTDGYYIAQYPEGNAANVSQPSYGTIAVLGGLNYEGVGAEAHQSAFDDVLQTGVGPVPDLVAGDYWIVIGTDPGDQGVLTDFFTFTLTQNANFRLGVITDQTPGNPPGLIWEASQGVGVRGPGGLDTGVVDVRGPGDAWRDADVDYVLFDITGVSGDVFTVYGEHNIGWEANALGGVFFDVPEPSAPLLAAFGVLGLTLRRRR
jgi:hypothetical protein